MNTQQKNAHDKRVEAMLRKRLDELEEFTERDQERAYIDLLDEIYSFDAVGGPFKGMSPARVLQECDETAFRCGLCDWMDSEIGENYREFDDKYYPLQEFDDLQQECEDAVDEEEAAEEAEQERLETERSDRP